MADDLNSVVLEALKRSAEGKTPTAVQAHVVANDDSDDRGATLKSKLMKTILAQGDGMSTRDDAEVGHDKDVTTAKCDDGVVVASLVEDLTAAVESKVEGKEADKDLEKPAVVIAEYLDQPGAEIQALLDAKFTPVWTSTPLKEADGKPSTPKDPQESKDESNDSFYDDEAFGKRLAETSNIVIFLVPLEGKSLDQWKPARDNWYAILASGVHVGRCRCLCYTLETSAFISEHRDISGAEEKLFEVVVTKMAERMIRYDKAHPVPATDFRCHLVTRLGDDTVVATVHHATRATFAEQLARRAYQIARSRNVDWSRIFTEGGLHIFVDASRSQNGNHVQHPLNRPATRIRIDYAAQARRDILQNGRALQSQWHFDVYNSYGVTLADGRTF